MATRVAFAGVVPTRGQANDIKARLIAKARRIWFAVCNTLELRALLARDDATPMLSLNFCVCSRNRSQ